MKISNSKKQLAKIIHENGGWCDGAEFAWFQGKCKGSECSEVWLGAVDSAPEYVAISGSFHSNWSKIVTKLAAEKFPNWHQTILSRDEYYHLYPAPVKVIVENHTTCRLTVTDGPSIEQLAADYRDAKDYAERKQQEADAAKGDAEAKLAAHVAAAGSAVGLVLSVAGVELVVTDWRELQENDWVWYAGDDEQPAGEYRVIEIEVPDYDGYRTVLVDTIGDDHWIDTAEEWRFIRRPAKETPNA